MSSDGIRPPRLTIAELLANPRVAAALTLGFASGLPFNLPQSTLQAWLSEDNLSLKTIGWFTLVAIPYWLKVLWAPLLDRYAPPFLGRRRGWILLLQLALVVATVALALQSHAALLPVAALGLTLVFLSASQDIVIDAYRTDTLRPVERGIGSTATQVGYRAATYLAGALALILSGVLGWRGTYLLMAAFLAATMLFTLRAPEPEHVVAVPRGLNEAVREPLREFLDRPGARALLLFALLYKFGDAFAVVLQTPFFIKGLGFTAGEVGMVAKVTTIVAVILGTITGGLLYARLGLYRSLLLFGLVQSFSNLSYSLLAHVGRNMLMLGVAVGVDQFAAGLGAAAFGAFCMAMCDARYSAFQFALLSAIAAIPRSVLGPVAGWVVEGGAATLGWHGRHWLSVSLAPLGWQRFFFLTTFMGLPAIALLWWLREEVRALDAPRR